MQSFMQAKTYILYNNILSTGMGDNGNEYCVRCNGKTFKKERYGPRASIKQSFKRGSSRHLRWNG